jgi:hypothetical protein
MIAEGYGDARTLERRAEAMEEWLENPTLMRADGRRVRGGDRDRPRRDERADRLRPERPGRCKPAVRGGRRQVDEVFIGSCMTNIGHFRAAGKLLEQHKGTISTRLWIVPPTRMDEHLLMEEGYYNIYGKAGARTEMPGCSLCMGNQARVAANSTVLSTSTRNFPNRLGDGANVYLTSAELAAVGAVLGKLPTPEEYMEYAKNLDSMSAEIYRYMNFDQIVEFRRRRRTASALRRWKSATWPERADAHGCSPLRTGPARTQRRACSPPSAAGAGDARAGAFPAAGGAGPRPAPVIRTPGVPGRGTGRDLLRLLRASAQRRAPRAAPASRRARLQAAMPQGPEAASSASKAGGAARRACGTATTTPVPWSGRRCRAAPPGSG